MSFNAVIIEGAPTTTQTFYARSGKRIIDFLASFAGLILLAPFMIFVALIIRLTSPGPALFRQERLGRGGDTFLAYKFRTMFDRPRVADTEYFTGSASEITAIGNFLRRTKLDELPQLLNVLRGEMSLVGPRPQLPIQLKDFDANARLRLLVRPGVTGMAQVHGNTALTWPERWYYDALYVKKLSLATDLWILGRTIGVILLGEKRFFRKPQL